VGDAPDRAVELVLTPLDADGERRLDFAVNGTVASAVLTRRLGRHTLAIGRVPGVAVTPRFVGGTGLSVSDPFLQEAHGSGPTRSDLLNGQDAQGEETA
jgi:hypothetical protein